MKRSAKNLKNQSKKMILEALIKNKRPIRWNALLKILPMSRKTFADRLSDLVEEELVERKVDSNTYPPSVYYGITAKGMANHIYLGYLLNFLPSSLAEKNEQTKFAKPYELKDISTLVLQHIRGCGYTLLYAALDSFEEGREYFLDSIIDALKGTLHFFIHDVTLDENGKKDTQRIILLKEALREFAPESYKKLNLFSTFDMVKIKEKYGEPIKGEDGWYGF